MNERSIAIIGAGIAGLSAGCYGQRNGFKTRLFEAHTMPGGVCAAWKRKGSTFSRALPSPQILGDEARQEAESLTHLLRKLTSLAVDELDPRALELVSMIH
jgi:phytoene dehydrogenase-like protein